MYQERPYQSIILDLDETLICTFSSDCSIPDKYKNMKSCIRLTSNIILVSAYYYICALGLSEPFRLEDLDHIS